MPVGYESNKKATWTPQAHVAILISLDLSFR